MNSNTKFIKEVSIPEFTETESDKEIIKEILNSQNELLRAYNNFNLAEDELIDYYIYKIKSEQSKIDYLLKKAKNKELVISSVESKNILKELKFFYKEA